MKRISVCLFIILIFLAMILIAASTEGATAPPELMIAINQVETGGRTGPILGDHGKALGPFQIHEEYWKDSGVKGTYSQCADYHYSVKVVTAYWNRFGSSFMRARNYEALARIHNGGPNGWRYASTKKYWAKVKKVLTK
jgi:hypothetical protein